MVVAFAGVVILAELVVVVGGGADAAVLGTVAFMGTGMYLS